MLEVPDTLRHYLGICEIGSALDPVVEVDVEQEIKLKVEVRDLHKIPAGTEITTKDLLLYDIRFEFDSIAEQGWYKFEDGNKRKIFEYLAMEDTSEQRDNDLQKRTKQTDPNKHTVSLGSLGLKQYEQVVHGEGRNKSLLGSCSNSAEIDVAGNKNEEQHNLLVKLQLVEELAARQTAQLMMEEKKKRNGDYKKKKLRTRGEKTT